MNAVPTSTAWIVRRPGGQLGSRTSMPVPIEGPSASLGWPATAAPGRPSSRRIGAIAGGLIAGIMAFALEPTFVAHALLAMVPPAMIGGWLIGPEVREHDISLGPLLGLACFVTTVGAWIVSAMTILSGEFVADLANAQTLLAVVEWMTRFLEITTGLALLGVFFLGLPALALTFACAVIWGAIVERLTVRNWR